MCAPLAPNPDELILFHSGGQARLGRLEGPQLDRWTVPPDAQVTIEGRTVDMVRARLVRTPVHAGAPVTETPEGVQRGEGVYAQRRDGKKLTSTRPTLTEGSRAPIGPLRWR